MCDIGGIIAILFPKYSTSNSEIMKARNLLLIIILFITTCAGTEGYKVRACAGQEARLNCSSGLYVDVSSADGGFGPSGTPCTSTASCNTSYVQGALTEVNGNIAAFAINTCKNKQMCNFMIQSSWQGALAYCNNKVYNITYVDVEYKCSPLMTTSTPTATSVTTTNSPPTVIPVTTTKSPPTVTPVTTTKSTPTVTPVTTTKSTPTVIAVTTAIVSSSMNNSTMSLQDNWWWYLVGGVGGVFVIVVLVIIVICVARKRRKKDNDDDDDESHNSGIMYGSTQSDDVMGYVTATGVSAGRNKPDNLYDDADATTSSKTSPADKADDVTTDDDKSADGALYAVVNKNQKSALDPNDITMIENNKYVSS